MNAMLSRENISLFSLDIEIKDESDWGKIGEAISNLKIKDLKRRFLLPLEISELIDETPRILFSGDNYSIGISPIGIGIRCGTDILKETIKKIRIEEEEIRIIDILSEAENNLNMFLGTFLGTRPKPVEQLNYELRVAFEFPLEEHLVRDTSASFLEKLQEFDDTAKFTATQIGIKREWRNKEITYRISERPEKINFYITKKFKSDTVIAKLVEFVDETIRDGNEILGLMGC